MSKPKPPADTSWVQMVNVRNARRASLWTVWAPILIAALAGFVAALAVAVGVALSWRPEGMGM